MIVILNKIRQSTLVEKSCCEGDTEALRVAVVYKKRRNNERGRQNDW